MWNPFDFTGRKYIVTGATSGIGLATAKMLASQGATVCLIARNAKALADTLQILPKGSHAYFAYDFSKPEGNIKTLFEDIVNDGIRIDGMVHCAGLAKVLPVGNLSAETMEESMRVNLYAFAEMVSVLSKKKYHNERCSIVGISSVSVKYPQKCQSIYVATKSAMNSLTEALAIELANKNMRINTVLPGVTNTPMQEAATNMSEDEIRTAIKDQMLGLLEPEDIANVILFLLSDASRAITGRALFCDGGTIPDLTLKKER